MRRRGLLQAGGAALLAAGAPAAAIAQPSRGASTRPLTVAQIVDSSLQEQDVSKDFLVGARAAWQDFNARGGLRGRPVVHSTVEVDGTPAAVRAALRQLRDNPGCVVLSGTVSDPVANLVAAQLQEENLPIAHAAPWLQTSPAEADDRTFAVFATRQEQIAHALRSLSVMGMQEIGVVYASARERQLYGEELGRAAAALKIRPLAWQPQPGADLAQLGQRLGPSTPAVLLFVGGTPELVQFTLGLERQARQRYVVALADVNLQTVAQMGAGRSTPVIATQAVPMVSAALPVVRQYREVLARLFDEPPVALSLAGFIAARYTQEVLASVDGAPTRESVLQAFRRRPEVDVGGFRAGSAVRTRTAGYVTQSMLTHDGRVVG